MARKLSSIFERRIAGAIVTQSIGVGGAAAIGLVTAALLTRFFTAEDFGLLALYIAAVAMISPIATGRYEVAILLPANIEDAISLTLLTLACAASVSCIILAIVFIWPALLPNLFGGSAEFRQWQWMIPIGLFTTTLSIAVLNLALRQGAYQTIAGARIAGALVTGLAGIYGGMTSRGAWILILSHILGAAFSAMIALVALGKNLSWSKQAVSPSSMQRMAMTYISFPKLSIAADFLGIASRQAPLLIFSHLFGPAPTGLLSLCQRAVGAISITVGKAIGEVFRKEASAERIRTGSFEVLFRKFFFWMSAVAIIIFLPLPLFGRELFVIAFGQEWGEAGHYAAILTPLFVASFVGGNLGWTVYIVERQKIDLLFQGLLIVPVLMAGICGYFYPSPGAVLAIISAGAIPLYGWYIVTCYRLAKGGQ